MRRALLAASAVLVLAACAKKIDGDGAQAPAAEAAAARGPGAPAVSAPSLAYRYSYGLEAPSETLRGLAARHEAACLDAGPATCQILGQSMHAEGRDRLSGELSLRATPDWLRAFRARLGEDVKAAGGKLADTAVQTEDLAKPIIDAQARLSAKTAARDRLQVLVASKAGSLQELRELRDELEAAQTEVESIKAGLAAMSAQVAMQQLKISYASSGMMAPDGTWSPVGSALRDVSGGLAFTLALLIRLATVLGPLAVLAVLGWKGVRILRPKTVPVATEI